MAARIDRLRKHFDQSRAVDLKYMSYSSEAMLQQAPRLSRVMLWLICGFIALMILWASLAVVDEFTRGIGRVVPSSDIQVIQNLEGGIVSQLLVDEGDEVEKGQPLVILDDTLVSANYREKVLQMAQLRVKAARLRAQARRNDFEAELETWNQNFPADIVEREQELFESNQSEFESEHDSLTERVEQKEQELSTVRSELETLRSSHRLLEEEVELTRPLVDSGAVSPVELLRLERELNDLRGKLESARLAVPRLESEYQEAKQNVQTHVRNYTSEARGELNEVISELGRLEESSQAFADRVERTVVRSPVRGTVKQLMVNTIGGVLQPGMPLMEIVPGDDSLLVDARIRPSDIAFIYPGQEATVKFTAYDYSIHGGLKAQVVHISPDTIEDEEGNPFYEVRLVTETDHLGTKDSSLPIKAGMTVEVDILTGEKTVMEYLLKPIIKTKELALRER